MPSKPNAASHPLGPLQAEYLDRPLNWRDLVLYFTPACLAALAPWAYGSWRSWQASLYYGPSAVNAWGMPWYSLAALALLPLLLLVWTRLIQAARWVHLHREGLHIRTRFGTQIQLPWEQIRGVAYQANQFAFLGRIYRTRFALRIDRATGQPLQIDPHLKNLDELAARIKARRYPRMLDSLRTRYRNGETLVFGNLKLQPGGLAWHKSFYPWIQIRRVDLHAGRLMVELHNQPALSIPAIQIYNLELLLQLIREGVNA